jgi:anti-repressor protein
MPRTLERGNGMSDAVFEGLQSRSPTGYLSVRFSFGGLWLRSALIDSEPWFVARDACRCLGIDAAVTVHRYSMKVDAKNRRIIRRHQRPDLFAGSRAPCMTFISEAGLHKLIRRSRMPAAKSFDLWVRQELLPTIHELGRKDLLRGSSLMTETEAL